MADRALVLLSGGLDSATCLYWAKQRFAETYAITFNYKGRVGAEKSAVAKLVDGAGVTRMIEIDLPFVQEASDFFAGEKKSLNGLPPSYIPARNMMFYSIAAYHAEFLGVDSIIGGHNLHDVELFRDASPEYIEKMNALFRQACLLTGESPYKIILPLAEMKRVDIIKLALKLRAPIELTWSCHMDGKVHCGSCYACKQRLEAFSSLGLSDPGFAT